MNGLMYFIQSEWEALRSVHADAYHCVLNLKTLGTPEYLVSDVVACCLRPDDPNKVAHSCDLCNAESKLREYEYKLFLFTDR